MTETKSALSALTSDSGTRRTCRDASLLIRLRACMGCGFACLGRRLVGQSLPKGWFAERSVMERLNVPQIIAA
jgi:hypothetical protein